MNEGSFFFPLLGTGARKGLSVSINNLFSGIIENDEESYAWQVLSWACLHTFTTSQKE